MGFLHENITLAFFVFLGDQLLAPSLSAGFLRSSGFRSILVGFFSWPRGTHLTTLLKSVQSALSDLLTTSATHGTFSRPSTRRGLILIGPELNADARELFEHC